MSRFERAYLIAVLEEAGRPLSADDFWGRDTGERTLKQITRDLERLEAEGIVNRTEKPTYCGDCGSDDGVEYLYGLA